MYSIDFGGKTLELTPYTLSVATKLEGVSSLLGSDKPIAEKLKSVYKLLCEILGSDKVNELLGSIDVADPCMLNIMFLKVIESYDRPLKEYNTEKAHESYDPKDIERLTDFLNSLNNVDKLSKVKN